MTRFGRAAERIGDPSERLLYLTNGARLQAVTKVIGDVTRATQKLRTVG